MAEPATTAVRLARLLGLEAKVVENKHEVRVFVYGKPHLRQRWCELVRKTLPTLARTQHCRHVSYAVIRKATLQGGAAGSRPPAQQTRTTKFSTRQGRADVLTVQGRPFLRLDIGFRHVKLVVYQAYTDFDADEDHVYICLAKWARQVLPDLRIVPYILAEDLALRGRFKIRMRVAKDKIEYLLEKK